MSRRNLAFRTALQIVVEIFPVLVHQFHTAEIGHALLWPTMGDGRVEVVFRQYLERIHERRTHQSLLLRTVAALAGHGAPGLPSFQRLVIDLVAILDGIDTRRLIGAGGSRSQHSRSHTD